MKISPFKFLHFYIFTFLFLFSVTNAQTTNVSISRTLKLGDSGEDVRALQIFLNKDKSTTVALQGLGSSGNETSYFGNATKNAVIKFQEKYLYDVLVPAGLRSGTGYVGKLTLAKISALNGSNKPQNVAGGSTVNVNPSVSASVPTKIVPTVSGVIPSKVRSGNIVTVNGSNFTPTGNTVRLRSGLLEVSFDNLTSTDGKTIVFTFKPPTAPVVTPESLYSLPPEVYGQIVNPVLQAGGSIEDITNPYRNMKSESDLAQFMAKNNRSFDNLYDYFYITVENSYGEGTTKSAMLYGLRQLPFGEKLSISESLKEGVAKISDSIVRKAKAQKPGGGFHSGMIMYCTCDGGYLTFDVDIVGGGGLIYFPIGYVPMSGSGVAAALWKGFYTPGAGGVCLIYAGLFCIPIVAGLPNVIWGASM